MDSKTIADLRLEYTRAELDEQSVHPNPFRQFAIWFEEALNSSLREANAMSLATVDALGHPNCRIVLLKGYDQRGFTFFSNYLSQKGEELDAKPHAALTLYWAELERQIRIQGPVDRVSDEESDFYFRSRPLRSQYGAVVSPQSEVVPNRKWLEQKMAEIEAQHPNGSVPRPKHWGGYRVIPYRMEFWQGRRSRLHDRILYVRTEPEQWTIQRLAP